MNRKIIAVTLLVFMSLAAAITPFAIVLGQNSQLGVSIIQVVPASEANLTTQMQSVYNGSVGQSYNIKGTIYTSNGTYNVIIGNSIVASGTGQGFYVNTNFTVPQLPGGDYNLLIEDVRQGNLNSTGSTPEQFKINPGYNITPSAAYSQEGATVTLTVQLTGGNSGVSYGANVTVVLPSPLNGNFSQTVTMVGNSVGTATATLDFPGNFQSGDSLQLNGLPATDFAGNYTCYFNMTGALADSQFQIGFLDQATYHRGQSATVTALGYASGQTATLAVTNVATGSSIVTDSTLKADSSGVITASFQVPTTASVGSYTATITTTSGNAKLMQDTQNFYVPGYAVTVTTLNLNGVAVSGIRVSALDQSANISYNATSDSSGRANFQLESGPYLLSATLKGVNIGQTNITVTGPGNFNFECQLTNLQVVVQNQNGTALSYVNLVISYTYGSSKTANVTGQTDYSGTYTLPSAISGVSYTIEASMYGQAPFNPDNDTISSLPAQAVYRFVIVAPTEQTTFNVVGYNNAPVAGANIDLVEITNGLFYTAITDNSGSATAPLTYGEYKVQINLNGVLLNETMYHAFAEGQDNIRCTLYGIQVSVSVVDYFGSPISNANVTLNGPAEERFSAMTRGDGTTTFTNVIGGNMQVVAFAKGAEDNYQALSLVVNQPTSVQIQMSGYVAFGSLLVPTTALLTLILVIVAIVLLVVVELFLRRRRQKASEA